MKLETLVNILKSYANFEAGSLEDLNKWTNRKDLSERGTKAVSEFRSQLSYALKNAGTITPKEYEEWTGMDVDTQEEVQAELQKIWDACFH